MNRSELHRMYYVAILCPKEIEDRVQQCKHWMREQCGCVNALKSPGHITLIPPFWMDEAAETELQQNLQSFSSNNAELEIQLQDFGHFGDRVLFINVNNNPLLNDVRLETETHFLQSFSRFIRKDERPFHPHITIANRDVRPSDFEKAWHHFSNATFQGNFKTKTISLLKLEEGKWVIIGEQKWS
jgi:2'-5' RNA ligase